MLSHYSRFSHHIHMCDKYWTRIAVCSCDSCVTLCTHIILHSKAQTCNWWKRKKMVSGTIQVQRPTHPHVHRFSVSLADALRLFCQLSVDSAGWYLLTDFSPVGSLVSFNSGLFLSSCSLEVCALLILMSAAANRHFIRFIDERDPLLEGEMGTVSGWCVVRLWWTPAPVDLSESWG